MRGVPVEVAAVDADNDPVRGREAAIKLELPLHVLILAVGHQSLPQCTQLDAPCSVVPRAKLQIGKQHRRHQTEASECPLNRWK